MVEKTARLAPGSPEGIDDLTHAIRVCRFTFAANYRPQPGAS